MMSHRTSASARPGFTLIELLLVIAIIGLIATIGMVGQQRVQVKRRDAQRAANVNELQKALALYLAKAGHYPGLTGAQPPSADQAGCITGTDGVTTALATSGFVPANARFVDPAFPTDTAKCYYYSVKASGGSYTLRYTLESNSAAGNAGDHLVVP